MIGFKGFKEIGVLELLGLEYRKTMLRGSLFYLGALYLFSPTSGFVRSGDYCGDLIASA
jgi:hypothetical protein